MAIAVATATRRTASILQLPSRMPMSPQLLLATVAISSSWSSGVPTAESFSLKSQQTTKAWGSAHRRSIHLTPRHPRPVASSPSDDVADQGNTHQSVTGPIYEMDGVPNVKLFTKHGCTLCDKVKDVLESVRKNQPHSLYAVDITDEDNQGWFSKYKYDIPVLHIDDIYWAKHKLSVDDAIAGIDEARAGGFKMRQGEPDASRLEHN